MKKNFQRLILSLLISLTFPFPQVIHAMEDVSNSDKPGLKRPPALRNLGAFGSAEESPQKRMGVEGSQENLGEYLPVEIIQLIFKQAAIYNILELGQPHIFPLQLLCKQWSSIINKDFAHEAHKSAYELLGHGEIYQRFYNGKLIYKPNENNNDGKIEMRISDLVNPLKGTFDLSKCGDAGKYLSISTGYREGKKVENASKVELWLTPRFLVEREINGHASHFKEIFPNEWPEKGLIGIIWTWGGDGDSSNYDYLTTQSMDEISNDNLHKKWKRDLRERARMSAAVAEAFVWWGELRTWFLRFYVSFVKCAKDEDGKHL